MQSGSNDTDIALFYILRRVYRKFPYVNFAMHALTTKHHGPWQVEARQINAQVRISSKCDCV
jgi:hypothetical protein